jgi:protein-tyrosine phosphatase
VSEAPRRESGGNGDPVSRKRRVLFVCLANICRSPAAAGVFAAIAERDGLLAQVEVDSAGISGYQQGEPPDPRMADAARRRGYELAGRARAITVADFAWFDLIVAMDRSNLRDLQALAGARPRQIRLLGDFLPEGWPSEVPDPYYRGDLGFEQVLDMLEEACPAILEALLVDA